MRLPVKGLLFAILFCDLPASAQEVTPNDPYFPYQTALAGTVSEAWQLATDASSVIVAVIDTGVALSHPDLQDNLWMNSSEIPGNGLDDDNNGYADDIHGYDFREQDGEPDDRWGHGTLTAGIIGAAGNNGIGTAGVAWSVRMMILKVFGASGGARLNDYSEAIRYAIQNGARVINAGWTIPPSFSGDEIPVLKEAIEEARDAGVLVVAAAGNDGSDLDESPLYPAAYRLPNVFSVAALGAGESVLIPESNYGRETILVATAGEQVLAPFLSSDYATLTGTSASASLVTGVLALLLSQRPDLDPDAIRQILEETSHRPDNLESVLRSGTLDPYASLKAALTFSDVPGDGEESDTSSYAPAGGCSLVLNQ